MGLLSQANLINQKNKENFSDFILKNKIQFCLVLSKFQNEYFLVNSIGADKETILQSASTQDFWEGIIPVSEKVYYFEKNDNSIIPLMQLFSKEKKDILEHILIYKDKAEDIIIFCNTSLDFEVIEKLNEIDYKKSVNKNQNFVQINKEDLKNQILKTNTKLSKDKIYNAFENEITNRINFILNDEKLKNKILSKEVSQSLISSHIKSCLKELEITENFNFIKLI